MSRIFFSNHKDSQSFEIVRVFISSQDNRIISRYLLFKNYTLSP